MEPLLPASILRAVAYRNGRLRIVDQSQLPHRVVWLELRTAKDAVYAIRRLAVRGAPNIGVAAAYALAGEARRLPDDRLVAGLRSAARRLERARPTAVNLSWAVRRVMRAFLAVAAEPEKARLAVEKEAAEIEAEEVSRSLAMSESGAKLISHRASILTICNTGPLAGPGLGTALGVILRAFREGKEPHVFVLETRPLLQGARLTAFELKRAGIDFTLIVDSAAATVMPECQLVLVGADRIARNGDVANKIGTRMLAILAERYRKPFYVAAPVSTFDIMCPNGGSIAIEERESKEITHMGGKRIAAAGAEVFNPAFDITPASFVTGFITERGIIRPPYSASIRRLFPGP